MKVEAIAKFAEPALFNLPDSLPRTSAIGRNLVVRHRHAFSRVQAGDSQAKVNRGFHTGILNFSSSFAFSVAITALFFAICSSVRSGANLGYCFFFTGTSTRTRSALLNQFSKNLCVSRLPFRRHHCFAFSNSRSISTPL